MTVPNSKGSSQLWATGDHRGTTGASPGMARVLATQRRPAENTGQLSPSNVHLPRDRPASPRHFTQRKESARTKTGPAMPTAPKPRMSKHRLLADGTQTWPILTAETRHQPPSNVSHPNRLVGASANQPKVPVAWPLPVKLQAT